MKLSFSSLGCPLWSLNEMMSVAKDLGYQGIELRGIGKDIFVPANKAFLPENVAATRQTFENKGLEISCLTSSCYLHLNDKDHLGDAKKYIDAAYASGALGVRVMGETASEPSDKYNDKLYIERLSYLCNYNKDVNIYIENNGVYANSDKLLSVIKSVGEPNLRVIWDICHPIVYYGESISYTFDKIYEYVDHIHLKDAKLVDGGYHVKMLGKGSLPVCEFVQMLSKADFGGYLSLEWLKRWNSELEEPGIVFAHYIAKVKEYLS